MNKSRNAIPLGSLPPELRAQAEAQLGMQEQPAVIPAIPRALQPMKEKTSDRQKTDEEKLNKTEKAYLAYLRSCDCLSIRIQAITLKLAFDCRLTVDFTYIDTSGRGVFVDVKGFQREDALIKMKVAARMYPEYVFKIVKKEGPTWSAVEVSP